MPDDRPNIILILTDQQRGDCLGIEGHPVLQTPNLDMLAAGGTHFRRGYSECPSCIPARRTLMSGQAPDAQGMVGYKDRVEWNPEHTLAGELTAAGYQTEMIGKLHLWPKRKRFGFNRVQLAQSTHAGEDNDYVEWLRTKGIHEEHPGVSHGVSANGWVGRPHLLPEDRTHTFWVADRAIDFLNRRDPTCPFFLNLSFIDPHPPLTPPQWYYDRYINRDLPMPVVGDWAEQFDGPRKGIDVNSSRVCLDEHDTRCMRAAYYGMINHIDDQIGRLINSRIIPKNTFFLFTSDHGEMLGDHNLYRKTFAYEASARVPFIARGPASLGLASGVSTKAPVGWQDVMPTLLDVAGVDIPSTCTGRSVLPLMRGEEDGWREYLHGEHSGCYQYDDGVHFLTDGHLKFVWYSQTGREQLFDLDADPDELHDIGLEDDADGRLQPWRARLVDRLKNRPEGFSDGEKLIAGREHRQMVPGVNRD